MTINRDLYMFSYPVDRTGKRAATDVIMQYSTPSQWAEQNPEAAERQRMKAALLNHHQPAPRLQPARIPRPLTQSDVKLGHSGPKSDATVPRTGTVALRDARTRDLTP